MKAPVLREFRGFLEFGESCTLKIPVFLRDLCFLGKMVIWLDSQNYRFWTSRR